MTYRRWKVQGLFTRNRYYFWTRRGAMRLYRRKGSDGSQLFTMHYSRPGWPK